MSQGWKLVEDEVTASKPPDNGQSFKKGWIISWLYLYTLFLYLSYLLSGQGRNSIRHTHPKSSEWGKGRKGQNRRYQEDERERYPGIYVPDTPETRSYIGKSVAQQM